MSERTLPQSLDILRQTLCDYIEASYHIRDPNLIQQRRALLKTPGVIAQVPYVETLPQYTAAKEGFLDTAWLPEGAAQAFQALNAEREDMGVPLPKRIFHPHRHQYEAVQLALGAHPDHAGERRSFVVTTGTGSGKTECFLLPILATLAQQAWEGQRGKAASAQKRWEEAAVRVIVLYPMNALVNDQLGRMRQWLGDPRLVSLFCDRWKLSRPLRFGRYTGRSLYPGVRRHVVRKDGAIERLKSGRPKFLVRDARRLDPKYTSTKRGSVKTVRSFYIAREAQALRALLQGKSAGRVDLQALELVRRLKQLGKWPAKPSMEKWFFGPQGDQTRNRWYKDGPALDGSKDEWLRAVSLPRDAELFTRHEVQAAPPDVLITNYSMLEFMLLRPLERGIFDKTRSFFEKNPDEKLLLVIDEAHMYRGTGGAEVAMLLRRLRERLGLPAERLQVICTSASFEGDAGPFAAKLTGKRPEDFNVVRSEVVRKVEAVEPTLADVAALCAVERDKFERPELTPAERLAAIMPLVEHRKGAIPELKELLEASTPDPEAALYLALQDWPPLARAFNSAMPGRKQPLSDGYRPGARPFAPLPTGHTQPEKALTTLVFGELGDAPRREQALTTLLALATAARRTPKGDPLLPARAHAFFRGLPGLWVCVDPQCSVLHPSQRGGHTGKLYAQDPGPACPCGARVFPLFTCRDCGTAFARGYTGVSAESYNKDGGQSVTYLWSHDGDFVAGSTADGDVGSLNPVDMLLELPRPEELVAQKGVRVRWLSLATGRLEGRYDEEESHRPGCRPVAIPGNTMSTPPARGKKSAKAEPNTRALPPGQFRPCPICRGEGGFGRSTVMDHETKGDQPFSALITGQLEIQRRRPGPAGEAKEDKERRLRHAPLEGRKVLIFSDSRQKAAGMSIDVNTFSSLDAVRPLLVTGWRKLGEQDGKAKLNLCHLAAAALLGEQYLRVRLRLVDDSRGTEKLEVLRLDVEKYLRKKLSLDGLCKDVPEAVAGLVYGAVTGAKVVIDKSLGEAAQASKQRGGRKLNRVMNLQTLAIGSVVEWEEAEGEVDGNTNATIAELLDHLPSLGSPFESVEEKRALLRLWLQALRRDGIWIQNITPQSWREGGAGAGEDAILRKVAMEGEDLKKIMGAVLTEAQHKRFKADWLPSLHRFFLTDYELLDGSKLTLEIPPLSNPGDAWSTCRACSTVQRTFAPRATFCIQCYRDEVVRLDLRLAGNQLVAMDDPFVRWFDGRKGIYRRPIIDAALHDKRPLIATAGEHTAQLGDAPPGEIFSPAEFNELLFQDIDAGVDHMGNERSAIDVLSCTTTMEVGIDIGSLSGVALRNMPPRRDNYQQRAGRAGRRGDGVATVIAYANNDSHDTRGFERPATMLLDAVVDPWLVLDNEVVLRRHIAAFLLQRYAHEAIGTSVLEWEQPQLFEVLGTVGSFLNPDSPVSLAGFKAWLAQRPDKEPGLRDQIVGWAASDAKSTLREQIQKDLYDRTGEAVEKAVTKAAAALSRKAPNVASATPPPPTPAGDQDPPDQEEVEPPPNLPKGSFKEAVRQEEAATEDPVVEDTAADGAPGPAAAPDAEHGRRRPGDDPELLPILMDDGVLPSYAFPTAVVSFHVFGEGHTESQPRFYYTPSQGLEQALTQYAPGREVKLDNRKYHVGAIYDPSPEGKERRRLYEKRTVYYHCERCGYLTTQLKGVSLTTEMLKKNEQDGVKQPCEKCLEPNPLRLWFQPSGFADVAADSEDDVLPAVSFATAAKLVVPTPDEQAGILPTAVLGGRATMFNEWRAELLVLNEGSKRKGFVYCTSCGRIEPVDRIRQSGWTEGQHMKPYTVGPREESACPKPMMKRGACLGFQFQSDVCLLRFHPRQQGLDLHPRSQEAQAALRTASEAVALAATQVLNLQPGELAADYRWGAGDGGAVELYIFDRVPGGAGYSFQVGSELENIMEKAAAILAHKDSVHPCGSACYHCVKSYSNRFSHHLLERHLGLLVLDALLGRDTSAWKAPEKRAIVRLIAADLAWQARAANLKAEEIAPDAEGRVWVDMEGDLCEVDAAVSIQGNTVALGMAQPFAGASGVDGRVLANRTLRDVQDTLSDPWTVLRAVPVFMAERNQPAVAREIFDKLKLGSGA